jgi:23S rRNA (cytidine1920-2'-O)/16S rRNA (cytidine1409-2'-O)-methyltransferase
MPNTGAGAGDTLHRLDSAIVARGLADSRTRAQRLIDKGAVKVNGVLAGKASQRVSADDDVAIDKGDDYASRGAYKLLGALEHFVPMGLPSPGGRRGLDIGASTGGFTDVLLRLGAAEVIALDVGHGQLIGRIRDDSRVRVLEGVNIRDAQLENLPFQPDYVVSDVSFISLRYVIPVIARLLPPTAPAVLLVKPQFEVGKEHLGRHGIVDDDDLRNRAVDGVVACALECGFTVKACTPSPITGMHGNVEFLLWLEQASASYFTHSHVA